MIRSVFSFLKINWHRTLTCSDCDFWKSLSVFKQWNICQRHTLSTVVCTRTFSSRAASLITNGNSATSIDEIFSMCLCIDSVHVASASSRVVISSSQTTEFICCNDFFWYQSWCHFLLLSVCLFLSVYEHLIKKSDIFFYWLRSLQKFIKVYRSL